MSEEQKRWEDCPAIRVMMMPRDTNAHGTIFGGVILSYLDQAGAIEARRHCGDRVVTVAMNSVEFKQPVFVGDVLSFYAETVQIGRTSPYPHGHRERRHHTAFAPVLDRSRPLSGP